MENIVEIIVNQLLRYGYNQEQDIAWIGLKTNDEKELRLAFRPSFQGDVKLALMLLQKHIYEERTKLGLPSIDSTIAVAVERLEYLKDDLNQIALIRTRFQNGASTDTPIEKGQIQQTIAFLQSALAAFDKPQTGH